MHTIPLIGYQEFKQAGVEGFFKLLDDLQINVEGIDDGYEWGRLLMDIIQSSEGVQHLPYPYWELLVELTVSEPQMLAGSTCSPETMTSLEVAGEWDKLECWMGVVWMLWSPEEGGEAEEDLGCITLSLFHKQQGAIQKLEQWMEQWADGWRQIPESFQQICKKAHDRAAQQARL